MGGDECRVEVDVELEAVFAEGGVNLTEAPEVKELVLKMKSGAVARGRGENLQECFNHLPEWVKA